MDACNFLLFDEVLRKWMIDTTALWFLVKFSYVGKFLFSDAAVFNQCNKHVNFHISIYEMKMEHIELGRQSFNLKKETIFKLFCKNESKFNV